MKEMIKRKKRAMRQEVAEYTTWKNEVSTQKSEVYDAEELSSRKIKVLLLCSRDRVNTFTKKRVEKINQQP